MFSHGWTSRPVSISRTALPALPLATSTLPTLNGPERPPYRLRTGIAEEDGDNACHWIAVHHADDHIHIVATLKREERRSPHRCQEAFTPKSRAVRSKRVYRSSTRATAPPRRAVSPDLGSTWMDCGQVVEQELASGGVVHGRGGDQAGQHQARVEGESTCPRDVGPLRGPQPSSNS